MKRFITSLLFLILLITAACAPLDLRIPATGPEPTLVPTIFIPTRTATPVVVANPTANATGTAAAVTTSIAAANATATALAVTAPTAVPATATVTPTATQPALPTVDVAFPSNGVQVNPGQQVIIRAVITAPAGIERIELWADGALVQNVPNKDTSLTTVTAVLPYSTQTVGTHSLTILAYDVRSQVGAGGPYRVDVSAPSVPQSDFTSPSGSHTTISAGENLSLSYWASSSVGVSRAELWVDGKLAFSDAADGANRAVFQHVWSSIAVGDHTFFIRVYDSAQNLSDSEKVTVTVKSSPPTTSITVPPNGAVLPAGQAVPVDITASDASGVTHVELWIDGLLYASWNSINPAGETPVLAHFAWQNPAAGSHAMYAVAFNKSGASTRTRTVQVTVTAPTATPSPSATPVPTNTPTPTATLTPTGTATP